MCVSGSVVAHLFKVQDGEETRGVFAQEGARLTETSDVFFPEVLQLNLDRSTREQRC